MFLNQIKKIHNIKNGITLFHPVPKKFGEPINKNLAKEKLNLSKVNRKISRALLVSEVANYDFGIGDAGVLFEALIIYTRVLSGYYDSFYNFNLAVAELNRAKSSWIGNP